MRVRLLVALAWQDRGTIRQLGVGSELELPEPIARSWLRAGRAVPVPDHPAEPVREQQASSRAPEWRRRRRRR